MSETQRRRPVPAAFREEHELDVAVWRHSLVGKGRGRARYTASGRCMCGERFCQGGNAKARQVRAEHADHVVRAYYEGAEYREQVRVTLRAMSDEALAFQDARVPPGGSIDRQELDAEINRRRGGA